MSIYGTASEHAIRDQQIIALALKGFAAKEIIAKLKASKSVVYRVLSSAGVVAVTKYERRGKC